MHMTVQITPKVVITATEPATQNIHSGVERIVCIVCPQLSRTDSFGWRLHHLPDRVEDREGREQSRPAHGGVYEVIAHAGEPATPARTWPRWQRPEASTYRLRKTELDPTSLDLWLLSYWSRGSAREFGVKVEMCAECLAFP